VAGARKSVERRPYYGSRIHPTSWESALKKTAAKKFLAKRAGEPRSLQKKTA
jgi:hypothetical protein